MANASGVVLNQLFLNGELDLNEFTIYLHSFFKH